MNTDRYDWRKSLLVVLILTISASATGDIAWQRQAFPIVQDWRTALTVEDLRGWSARLIEGDSLLISPPGGASFLVPVYNPGGQNPFVVTPDGEHLLLSINEEITCFQRNGQLLWTEPVEYYYNPLSMAVSEDYVVYDEGSLGWGVASSSDEFYWFWLPGAYQSKRMKCRELRSGRELWNFPILATGAVFAVSKYHVLFLRPRSPETYEDYLSFTQPDRWNYVPHYLDVRSALTGKLLASWLLPGSGCSIAQKLFLEEGTCRSTMDGFHICATNGAPCNQTCVARDYCELKMIGDRPEASIWVDDKRFALSLIWLHQRSSSAAGGPPDQGKKTE